MRIIKILNTETEGPLQLFLSKNDAYLIRNGKKLTAKLINENEKNLVLYWDHVGVEQKYVKISNNCIVKVLIFEKFNPKKYVIYNQDLKGRDNLSLYNHYTESGMREGRIYDGYKFINCNIEHSAKLPDDFNPSAYRNLNADIYDLDDESAEQHYIRHGFYENRTYKYEIDNEDFRNLKYSPIFINHDLSLTGAPIFLYEFVRYLIDNEIISNPIIIESSPNKIFDKYGIKNKLYHYNNPKELLKIIEDINPIFIYSNSLSLMFLSNYLFKKYFYKTFFHMHESLENVNKNLLEVIKDEKILLVAEKIKKEFLEQGCTKISLFPPFLSKEKIYNIKSLSKMKTSIKNQFGNLDESKIVVGMSGSISFRKNFILLYELAKKYKNIEFVWIGGEKDWQQSAEVIYKKEFKELPNFFHIPYTNNPYAYLNKIDYFFLTSKNDPCPIVVLEALFLNKSVIVVKDSIFYDHSKDLDDNYIVIDSSNDNEEILRKFKKLSLSKNKQNQIGENYILQNFSKPRILEKERMGKNYLVLSYYYNQNNNLNDIDYYVNIINMFNINQNLEYNILINIKIDFSEEDVDVKSYYKKIFFNKFKNVINLLDVAILQNKGWDIGGLLNGIKYAYDSGFFNDDSKLAYLHNKSNANWREELIKIFYCQKEEIESVDTVVSSHFFVACPKNDPNRETFKKHYIFGDLQDKSFEYIQGNVFITFLKNLKPLYDNYDYFYNNLTDVNKKDDYWISKMKDAESFNQYFRYYEKNKYNTPIDADSHEIIKQDLAFNFIDLYQKFGKKGIPDCHFEHAVERYIGHLISTEKKVKKV